MFFFFITFFRYFIKLFYSFHYISFPFLKGCRLEKGHIVPVVCSYSYERKKKQKAYPQSAKPLGSGRNLSYRARFFFFFFLSKD